MQQQPTLRIYEFADFCLDAQRRVLSSRVDGQPLPLTGKVFDTLLYFVERAGQVLDKHTLMEALWPNAVVEESNLTQTIHTLRRVLGEKAGEHKFIVTVPGRGYSFVADVKVRSAEAVTTAPPASPALQNPPRRHRMMAAAIAGLAVVVGLAYFLARPSAEPQRNNGVPPMVSVAVLPFVDMSDTQDQVYFADGLSEEILNLLAQSSGMRVIARTSSFSFKNRQELDVETIARSLEATHVLEGSVRKSGDRIRVTAQLVDGVNSGHLWSQTYDRKVTDIFSVQDDIASAVAAALHATLGNGEERPRADSTNPQAFERYLHGRFFFNRRGESDLGRAKEQFEQALQIDPTYARAWAGLAGTYHASVGSTRPASAESSKEWLESIERGLSLGPGLPETHVRAAQYYWWLGDMRTSDEHCKVAIALNPSDALVLGVQASKALAAGKRHEAVSLQRRTVAVDPLSAPGRVNLAVYLAAIGEWQQAEAEFRHARELSPTLPTIDVDIARMLVLQRRFPEALDLLGKAPASALRDQVLALAHHGMGNEVAATEAFARLTAVAEAPDADPVDRMLVAEFQSYSGNEAAALKVLNDALAAAARDSSKASVRGLKFEILASPILHRLQDPTFMQSMHVSVKGN